MHFLLQLNLFFLAFHEPLIILQEQQQKHIQEPINVSEIIVQNIHKHIIVLVLC